MKVSRRLVVGIIAIMLMTGLGVVWSVLSPDYDLAVAIGTFVLGGATLLLALVAFYQVQDTKDQHLETQRASVRPLLVPMGTLGLGPSSNLADFWSRFEHTVGVRNHGNGVATNVRGVMLPSIEPHPSTNLVFSMALPFPIGKGEGVPGQFETGGILILPGDRIAKVPLHSHKDLDCYVRLTLTYWDILGSKHASVFDFTKNGTWKQVAICNDIPEDLEQLTAARASQLRLNVPTSKAS